MFQPLALYIGLRYTRAKRRNQFISFISMISVIGIALGITVLVTVLSVMNGFDQQIRFRIFSIVPHITVTGLSEQVSNWPELDKKIKRFPFVVGSAPYVNGQGLLTHDSLVRPAMISGVLPERENQVSVLSQKMIAGSLGALKPNQFGIVLGQILAENLGALVGDSVNLVTPQVNVTPVGVIPRYKRFKVVGIFNVGNGFGFDGNYAFIHLQDAQTLFATGEKISGIQLKINDLFAARSLSLQIEKSLGFQYQVSNWADSYGAFYHAVQMEKTMMFFILLLLVAIAAFNLVSGLVMLVNDKQADIAILRTLGATPRLVMTVFVVQGCILGVAGTLLGVIGGVILSLNVTRIVDFIQGLFHVQLLTSGVYFVDYLPSQLLFSDVFNIAAIAILMSFLATIYPAWRAARVQPVEALRYE